MSVVTVPLAVDRILSRRRCRLAAAVSSRALLDGEVLRLDATARATMVLQVVHGTVWVTTTPAGGDVILGTGESLTVVRGWPVVAQALGSEATVEVTWPG